MRKNWTNDYFQIKFKISPFCTHCNFLKRFYLDSASQNEYYNVSLSDFE